MLCIIPHFMDYSMRRGFTQKGSNQRTAATIAVDTSQATRLPTPSQTGRRGDPPTSGGSVSDLLHKFRVLRNSIETGYTGILVQKLVKDLKKLEQTLEFVHMCEHSEVIKPLIEVPVQDFDPDFDIDLFCRENLQFD